MIKQSKRVKTTAAATAGGKQMNMAKAHHLLGHTNHHPTIDMAKHLEWSQIKDFGKICQPCAEAKSK